MKLKIASSIFLCVLIAPAFASYASKSTLPKFYIGAFGGGGSSNTFNVGQFGTAYYAEADGGPLAVNAFGQLGSESSSFFGLQLGYQAPAILLSSSSQWTLGPAVELEGYSMNNSTFQGTIVNNTTRAPEHNFDVSYPMSRTILLGNAVLNFNTPRFFIHPYIGFGIGDAIIRISGADSTQVSPPEAGVNHYNSNSSDSTSAFAGQIKLGLSYDINNYVSLFADYRWLYLASTDFLFGSTVYTDHVATSSWQVKMDAQRYNLGNVGIRVNV